MTRAQRRAHAIVWLVLALALAGLAAHALVRRAVVISVAERAP